MVLILQGPLHPLERVEVFLFQGGLCAVEFQKPVATGDSELFGKGGRTWRKVVRRRPRAYGHGGEHYLMLAGN